MNSNTNLYTAVYNAFLQSILSDITIIHDDFSVTLVCTHQDELSFFITGDAYRFGGERIYFLSTSNSPVISINDAVECFLSLKGAKLCLNTSE